jgi:asparaginyl-tRNA synthetase
MAAAAAACRLLRLAPRRLRPLTGLSILPTPLAASSGWRRYCAAAQAAAPPPTASAATGETVGEFRRRIRVSEVKGGEDEGAAWVGKDLTVRGWVRTCRAQRTVTFVEVRGGTRL